MISEVCVQECALKIHKTERRHQMRGRLECRAEQDKGQAAQLCSELAAYKAAGVSVTVDGYQAAVDRRLADMLLRDGPCTYMRAYSFDEEGKVTQVGFERVKLSSQYNK